MQQHCRDMLDAAVLNFHSELGRYDWIPSTAMAGTSVGVLASLRNGDRSMHSLLRPVYVAAL